MNRFHRFLHWVYFHHLVIDWKITWVRLWIAGLNVLSLPGDFRIVRIAVRYEGRDKVLWKSAYHDSH